MMPFTPAIIEAAYRRMILTRHGIDEGTMKARDGVP